ncbi:MerR family transcriptional regulator [Actinokineospora sp. HUAS TT18]|uniref:MerR family transcriptional regulator n=1 Tax=Actinokineospora sp. HUAS TT18 TaxID=3447451 RepID=UPI003F5271FF
MTKSEQARPSDSTEGATAAEEDESGEPTLPVAAVARRLGIAPATLRTWDRRYGVGPSGHTTGRHRRYAPSDIARLELMQRALLKGAAPAEAAEYALRVSSGQQAVDRVEAATEPEVDWVSSISPDRPDAGGLGRAALAMDEEAVQRMIADAVEAHGVVVTWDSMVRPVLAAVANRWVHAGDCVEIEHLLDECVLAAMIRATPLVPTPRNARPVLLTCAPGERHSLPLYVLRAALARRSLSTRMLGAALPAAALAAAVRRTAPSAVALWAQVPANGDAAVLDQIPRTRQHLRVFACGPGWFDTDMPGRAEHLDELADAVDRIEAVVLGEADSAR